MLNKRVLITGGTGGIGLATAHALGAQGATLSLTGKSEENGRRAAAGLPGARFLAADHTSLASMRQLAAEIRRTGVPEVLIHNVGGIFASRAETAEGFEASLALNHLSSFVLTAELAAELRPRTQLTKSAAMPWFFRAAQWMMAPMLTPNERREHPCILHPPLWWRV